MSPQQQSIAALVLVALAVIGLVIRYIINRKKPGCGGECACPAQKLRR